MESENTYPAYDDSVYEFVFDRLHEGALHNEIVAELIEQGIPNDDAEDLVQMASQVEQSGAYNSATTLLQNVEDSRQMMQGGIISLAGIVAAITFQHFWTTEYWLGYICVLPIGYGALRFFMAQQRLKRNSN